MKKVIPHSRPSLGAEECAAAVRVIKSGFLAQGAETAGLERDCASLAGVRQGAAASSGTAALYLALRALGAGPGSEVVIPSYVCSSLWHAVKLCGAAPVLADSDPETFNLDPDSVKRSLGRKTVAVIVPHMFGLPAAAREIARLGVPVVEDCAQALGASSGGRRCGSSGAASVLSFYATKLAAAGEGGMVLSGSEKIISRVRDLRAYDGLVPDEPRFNFKLTDLQAAVARVQLRRLETFLARRAALAREYGGLLGGAVGLPRHADGRIYHRYVVLLPGKVKAEDVEARLERRGVCARKPVFRPLHLDVACKGRFAGAEKAWKSALSLPLYPEMTAAQCRFVAAQLSEVLKGC